MLANPRSKPKLWQWTIATVLCAITLLFVFGLMATLPNLHKINTVQQAPLPVNHIKLSKQTPASHTTTSTRQNWQSIHDSLPPLGRLPTSPNAIPLKPANIALSHEAYAPSLNSLSSTNFPLADLATNEPTIFQLNEVDKMPIPIQTIPPIYPWELKRNGISGEVKLRFIVDANGNPSDISAESSSHPQFEKNAIQAISQWKFKPASRNGQNVSCWVRLPMPFMIEK